jgi:hypothetical protein
MTQSLLNFMNSPLAITALILWLLLAFLAFRTCRKWASEKKTKKIIVQNHSAIPVKKYDLSQIAAADPLPQGSTSKPLVKLSAQQRAERPTGLPNLWDV